MENMWCLIPIAGLILGIFSIVAYSDDHKDGEMFGDYLRRVTPVVLRDLGRALTDLFYHARSLVIPTPKAKRKPNEADNAQRYDPYSKG